MPRVYVPVQETALDRCIDRLYDPMFWFEFFLWMSLLVIGMVAVCLAPY